MFSGVTDIHDFKEAIFLSVVPCLFFCQISFVFFIFLSFDSVFSLYPVAFLFLHDLTTLLPREEKEVDSGKIRCLFHDTRLVSRGGVVDVFTAQAYLYPVR